jgi:hypothetical protein
MIFISTKSKIIVATVGSTMMRRLMLILLSASSLLLSSQGRSATSPRRHLQRRNSEEHPDQDFHLRRLSSDSNDSNDSADSDESDDDDVSNNNIVAQAKDHVEQDFIAMWSSPPNEWSQEYWEVFAGLLLLVIVGGLCVCIACIVPICFPFQSPAPLKELDDNNVMSNETSEPGAYHDKVLSSKASSHELNQPILDHQPILDQPSLDQPILDQPSLDQPILDQPSLDQPILDQPILDQPSLDHGSDCDTSGALRSKYRPKKKLDFWSEVVSVWRELFVDLGLCKEEGSNQKYNRPYRKYKERHIPAASARKASSHNKYKAPYSGMSKKKKMEYDTDDASSSNEEEPRHIA